MSSIVVAGDVSGSVTLSAPSAAGSVTVTLPSASGTMLTTASTITPSSGSVNQAALATGVAGTGPAFSAYQNADQTGLASNTYTKCNFQVEEYDTNNNFASSRFTPTVAGYYQVNWGADILITGGGSGFIAALYQNGSLYRESNGLFSGSATELQVTGSTLIYMNGSTDYLEVYVRATGGSARQTFNGSPYTFFNGFLARAA